jgi:hypothetical protein
MESVGTYLHARGFERVHFTTLPPDLGPTWESPASREPDASQPTLWDAPQPMRADAEMPAGADVAARDEVSARVRTGRRTDRA